MKRIQTATKTNSEQSLKFIVEATLCDLSDAESQTIQGGEISQFSLNFSKIEILKLRPLGKQLVHPQDSVL